MGKFETFAGSSSATLPKTDFSGTTQDHFRIAATRPLLGELTLPNQVIMPSQSLLQLRTITLHPAPDRCVVDVETTLLQQFLHIPQRKRIAKYHWTAQSMNPGSVCRHLKFAGRVTISRTTLEKASRRPRGGGAIRRVVVLKPRTFCFISCANCIVSTKSVANKPMRRIQHF
jgi:hypothetical protein